MQSRGRRLVAAICFGLLAAAIAAGMGSAGSSPTITQTSIAGVKLGMTMAQAKATLGKPVQRSAGTFDNPGQPDSWTRLAFPRREVSVYFIQGNPHAVMVTTWNKSDRTAAGIGPCSPRATVKKAYGSTLKQSSHAPAGFGYTLGSHLFIGYDAMPPTPSPTVTAIGLFGPTAGLGYATFVTLSDENCG
jgi:hypothetical protein